SVQQSGLHRRRICMCPDVELRSQYADLLTGCVDNKGLVVRLHHKKPFSFQKYFPPARRENWRKTEPRIGIEPNPATIGQDHLILAAPGSTDFVQWALPLGGSTVRYG